MVGSEYPLSGLAVADLYEQDTHEPTTVLLGETQEACVQYIGQVMVNAIKTTGPVG